jgi:hypothetical protein
MALWRYDMQANTQLIGTCSREHPPHLKFASPAHHLPPPLRPLLSLHALDSPKVYHPPLKTPLTIRAWPAGVLSRAYDRRIQRAGTVDTSL